MNCMIRKLRDWLIPASSVCLLAGGIVVLTFPAASAGEGEATFKAKCAMCHAADGSGNTPMGKRSKIRDLRSPDVQKQTDDELAAIISNGRPPMPAYSKTLSATDIRQIVVYIRTMANKS